MTNKKKTIVMTMALLAGVLLLAAFWLYVGRLYSNSFLSRRPDHGVCYTVEGDLSGAQRTNYMPVLKEAMRKRFHRFGTRIHWEQVSETKFNIYAPIIDDRSVQAAKAMLFRKGKLEFRVVHPNSRELVLKGQTADGYEVLYSATEPDDSKGQERAFLVSRIAEGGPSGFPIRSAFPVSASGKTGRQIGFTLTPEGGAAFSAMTREKIGQRLAIVMDGKILAAPRIREQITTGGVALNGTFTQDQTFQILTLMTNPLPIPVNLVETKSF